LIVSLTPGTRLRLLGTAARMSPEQARSRLVDNRTDIWAFGCALYQKLAGRRAIDGEHVADTLAAVLRAIGARCRLMCRPRCGLSCTDVSRRIIVESLQWCGDAFRLIDFSRCRIAVGPWRWNVKRDPLHGTL
jgi:serine/threonine protein kinase